MGVNVWKTVNRWTLIPVKALVKDGAWPRRISDAEVGTGLKPLVALENYVFKVRSGTEGVPVVYDAGNLRLLRRSETLVI